MRVTNNDENPRWFGDTLLYKGQSADIPDSLIEEIRLNDANLPAFELGLIVAEIPAHVEDPKNIKEVEDAKAAEAAKKLEEAGAQSAPEESAPTVKRK